MTTLTTTQRSALVAINHKHMTSFGLVKELGVARALAQNLLDALVKAGFAKKYESGQYTPTDAGKAYLRGEPVPEKAVFAVGKTRGRPSNKQKAQATTISQSDMSALEVLDSKQVDDSQVAAELPVAPEPSEVSEFAVTAAPVVMPVAELPTDDQSLPVDIDMHLAELEQKLTTKIIAPSDIDLKVKVLNRLGALLEPSISEVLTAIAADLQQLKEAA